MKEKTEITAVDSIVNEISHRLKMAQCDCSDCQNSQAYLAQWCADEPNIMTADLIENRAESILDWFYGDDRREVYRLPEDNEPCPIAMARLAQSLGAQLIQMIYDDRH